MHIYAFHMFISLHRKWNIIHFLLRDRGMHFASFFSTCRRSLSTSKRKASTKNQTLRCTRTITYFYRLSHNLFFGHHNLVCYKNRLLPLISKRIKKKRKKYCANSIYLWMEIGLYTISVIFFLMKCAKHEANFESERAPAKRFHIIIYKQNVV